MFLLRSEHDPDNSLLNLGLPQVREYITDAVSRIIASSGVDIYRQDFNFPPLKFWRAADAPDRVGMSEIRHIEGLYAMWDELRLGPATLEAARLYVTTLIGWGRVVAVQGRRVELDYHLMTRTGNLHLTRLQRETGGAWAQIAEAHNPDADHTVVELERPLALRVGDRVSAVDCVVGDEVVFEPVCGDS